jgi:hypothetical protein
MYIYSTTTRVYNRVIVPNTAAHSIYDGNQTNNEVCSETTLTGESRLHISPPRGFEPVSLVTGSKQVVHWTSETWWEWSEIAGSAQGSPTAANSVGCEARRETCSERETGTGKLCDQVDLSLQIVGAEPSEAPWGWRSQWLDHVRANNVARQR